MRSLVVLIALVTWSAASTIPLPEDVVNNVDAEPFIPEFKDAGKAPRADMEGTIDYEYLKTRNGANNQYWLFTRSNPTSPQVITHGNANSIWQSNYNGNLPLNVIVHGWRNHGWSDMNPTITSAFLAVTNCNVIVVDWSGLANQGYYTAVAGVPSVGQFLGNFLLWLRQTGGGAWNNVHLVGFSLGAHVVGNAGRQAHGWPARVTGLDPAGYLWHNNANALNRNAGQYVETIHTDGGVLGIMTAIGDGNFYPNGGKHPQPGCFFQLTDCSHGRAPPLFAATVHYNHLTGRQCPNIGEAELGTCSGASVRMGNGDWNKRANGIFALRTTANWPF